MPVVSSLLYRSLMKYVDEEGEIRTMIAEKFLLKGVKVYFTDFFLYQDFLEITENPSQEDSDSGNEADAEIELKEECLWELNPLVKSIDKLDFKNTANNESGGSLMKI